MEVSLDNCASPDAHSSRVPSNDETGVYFLLDSYTGYFRATEKNDCDSYPTTCTGMFVDFPCGWTSYAEAQFYHMGIALEAVQFTYDEQLQIIEAANATESDIMFKWWTPSALNDEFFGTQAEFIQVTFPPNTKVCTENRILIEDRCSDVFEDRVGSPEGACAEPTVLLRKVLSAGFKEATHNPNVDRALWSPAYETVQKFQISNVQLEEISRSALQRKTDKWNYDLKEAACHWVVENMDFVELIMPESYPRAIQDQPARQRAGSVLATIVSYLALVLICWCFSLVYRGRGTKVIQRRQIEFLYLYLVGLLLVAVSSILTLYPTSDRNCTATFWLISHGHFVIFVLLGLKVDAINRFARSGKVFQRVNISAKQMMKAIGTVSTMSAVIFLLWAAFDRIKASAVYNLSDDITDNGEVAITISNTCVLPYYLHATSFCIEGLLLLYTLALGFLISQNKDDINAGKTLTAVAAVHGVLSSFRFISFLLADALSADTAMSSQSIFLALDCFLALAIVPVYELLCDHDGEEDSDEPLPDLFLNAVRSHSAQAYPSTLTIAVFRRRSYW